MKSIAITGAAGFIGSALAEHFAGRGWRVVGYGRRRPASFPPEARWLEYDLTWAQLPAGYFDGVDVVVHAAFVKGDYHANVMGSMLLLDAAQAAGAGQVVFLSSLAAHDGALSEYGKQKYVLERTFAGRGALVVRPGLVLGKGSIFASTCEYLRGHRFVPLIGGGAQPLQTVYIDDLVAAIDAGIERCLAGVFTVAEDEPATFREFYAAICERLGVTPAFVSLPFVAADAAVRIAAAMRIALPIDRENLLGLRAMRRDRGPRLDPPAGPVADFRRNIARALE